MGKSVYLHPEHGLNPSLDTCFWCGEAVGVALLGLNKGKKAPHAIHSSYEPCPNCQAKMSMGVTLIECTGEPGNGLAPTGRYVVVTRDAIPRIINNATLAERILEAGRANLDEETFRMLTASVKVSDPAPQKTGDAL